MSYVAVTLDYGTGAMDVALPMHIPSRLLVDGLVESLKLPKGRGRGYYLGVKADQGVRRISPNASLGDMLIFHGMTLALLPDDQKGKAVVETGASLRTENGTFFPLKSKVTLIGRNDPKSGIFVEIDLAAYATDPKIISRKHAQIDQEGDRFYLVDLGSVNGTKLNGQRIPPKERKPIWDGDLLEFGKDGVQMTFQGGGKKSEKDEVRSTK